MTTELITEAARLQPIQACISADDIRHLYAAGTSPDKFNQLILAKLKDSGAPVEGTLRLRLAHGQVYKVKDNPTKPQEAFMYMWLPETMVHDMARLDGVAQ